MSDMSDTPNESASNSCMAHQLVDGHVIDPQTARDVGHFRKALRQELYAKRKAVPLVQRQNTSAALAEMLNTHIGDPRDKIIAAYWPIRGEPDLRNWMAEMHVKGAILALPTMPAKHQPLEFHRWTPESEMKMGHFHIPIPQVADPLDPDLVIVPLLGVDQDQYRLGNGGGYYDRTLARRPNAQTIGIGAQFCQIKTIFPQAWDIRLNTILLAP
ncbi:5,10-methenyltetrahydrofolate synthetase [Maritalea mobilis]|uniref:5-formyltetrahydrofolate cyclo-ligase n=1 Tax=Maritalea mobilis TaxID=483324 RepID=A0A4R6VIZ5_9HYPH|nr:5-formyltetrahydrofolate cyclo-ligase [Maritalea mobilis]TDQ61672.1 5,10-methenyltetrahydrofolate synthetase [Maritalea mobilis]